MALLLIPIPQSYKLAAHKAGTARTPRFHFTLTPTMNRAGSKAIFALKIEVILRATDRTLAIRRAAENRRRLTDHMARSATIATMDMLIN